MFISPTLAKTVTSRWIAQTFTRFYLWIRRARGMKCRDCGMEIPVAVIVEFTLNGCPMPECTGKKLDLIKEDYA
jgi:hypothetical protein